MGDSEVEMEIDDDNKDNQSISTYTDEDSTFPILPDYESEESDHEEEEEGKSKTARRRVFRGVSDDNVETESVVSMLSLDSHVSYVQSSGCSFVSRAGNMVWIKDPLPPRARKRAQQVKYYNKTFSRAKPFKWKRYYEVPARDVETGITFVSKAGNLCWRPKEEATS